jgi:hypothetical protein
MKLLNEENACSRGCANNSRGNLVTTIDAEWVNRKLELVSIERLIPRHRNPRTHSKKQIGQIVQSIKRFGFTNPVLIDDADVIIAGHGRVEAAKLLGLTFVPALRLSHLSAAEKRAYVIADNKLAANAGWDREILGIELHGLIDIDFEAELTGFDMHEIEIVLDDKPGRDSTGAATEASDFLRAVSQPGDRWILGSHQLICGDPLDVAHEADIAIRRWQSHTGKPARLAATGQSFAEIELLRTDRTSPAIAATRTTAAKEARDV